jgi:hypothetical protein
MKILTLHQCSGCNGTGVDTQLKNDFENGKLTISESIPLPHSQILRCQKCQGAKVEEIWMDAREFIRTYMDEKINPE